ncbi:MAG: hypothetical protein AB7F59_13045 [Bdellovibrionales bacterium]
MKHLVVLLLFNFVTVSVWAATSEDCKNTIYPFSCSYLRAFENAKPLDLESLPKRELCWSRVGGGSATNLRYNLQARHFYKHEAAEKRQNDAGVESQHAVIYINLKKPVPTAFGFPYAWNFDGFSGLLESTFRKNAEKKAKKVAKKTASPLIRRGSDWVTERYEKITRGGEKVMTSRVTYRQLDGFLIAAYDINPPYIGFEPDFFLEVPLADYQLDCKRSDDSSAY